MEGRTSPLWAGLSPLGPLSPYLLSGVPGTPSGDPICTRYPMEHFLCPNTIVLYINIYLSTISRLLVMSVISSGTPNNIRSPNHITHIILCHHRTLSVQTLRVRELCRHDRDTSLANNQKRNLDAHIGSHIFYEDLYQSNCNDNIRYSLSHRYVTCPRFDRWYLHT